MLISTPLSICQLVIARDIYCIVLGTDILSGKATGVCIIVAVRILLFGRVHCDVWLHRVTRAVASVRVAVVHRAQQPRQRNAERRASVQPLRCVLS